MPLRSALIIGINDHSNFDPSGRSNLRGARNDALEVLGLARRLGFSNADVRMLSAPVLPEVSGDGSGVPTAHNIRAGVEWLARRLAEEDEPVGLLAFSGHGHTVNGELALVPVEGPDHAVPVQELQEILERLAPGKGITLVLDCCHAPLGQAPEVDFASHDWRACDVVLAAGGPGQRSAERVFGGSWQGAFTWALGRVAEQWVVEHVDGTRRLAITYEELAQRAGQLMGALDVPQVPRVWGQGRHFVGDLRRTVPSYAPSVPATAATAWRQIWGGQSIENYKIMAGGQLKGWLVVVTDQGSHPQGYPVGKETWTVDPGTLPPNFDLIYTTTQAPPQFNPGMLQAPQRSFAANTVQLPPTPATARVVKRVVGETAVELGWFGVDASNDLMWFSKTSGYFDHNGGKLSFIKVGAWPGGPAHPLS